MEVHKHPHHVMHTKQWKEYLLEFLMIFLAVFLGFIAENLREAGVENHRAKAYASNLVDDLKKDTAALNKLINSSKLSSGKLDTFCSLVKSKERGNVTSGMLYYYATYATNVSYFSPHNATIEQLKNSGNLRLMGNEVAHEISEYDKDIRGLEREYGLSKSEFDKIEDLHFKIFDVYYMQTLLPDRARRQAARDSLFLTNSLPVLEDKERMKEYTGLIKFEADIYLFQVNEYLEPIKRKAIELLWNLTNEYHID